MNPGTVVSPVMTDMLSSDSAKPKKNEPVRKEGRDQKKRDDLFTSVNSQCGEARKKIERDVALDSFVPLSDMGPSEMWADRKELTSSKKLANQLCSNQLYYEVLQLKQELYECQVRLNTEISTNEAHKNSIASTENVNAASHKEVKRLQADLNEAKEENAELKNIIKNISLDEQSFNRVTRNFAIESMPNNSSSSEDNFQLNPPKERRNSFQVKSNNSSSGEVINPKKGPWDYENSSSKTLGDTCCTDSGK